jgi:hypothetical protein
MMKKDADGDTDCTPTACPKPHHPSPHAPMQKPGQHHGPAHAPIKPVHVPGPRQGQRQGY